MSESSDGPGRREVAYRLFATEYDDADLEHSESDEERAPNYVITPTGGRVNRVFVAGVLTEVEPVSDDVLRGRVVDPTGAFVLYAGQYQPDERAVLDRTEPPAFVAVTGKARTFQPEEGSRVFTSVRPEAISDVDADARDRWTVDAAEQTLHRVEAMATALALDASGDRLREALEDRGCDPDLAAGIDLAIQHYGTSPTYLAAVRDLAIDAARHVAGELDEVPELTVAPDEAGDVTPDDLLAEPVEPLPELADASPAETAEEAVESAPADTVEAADEPGAGAAESEADEPSSESDEVAATTEQTGEGPGDFESESFELDADERAEIEDEYGTEFQSAAEVEKPGEADIETPEPEAAPESDAEDQTDAAAADEDEAAEGEVDLEDAAVSAMAELDEGDGADRAAVVETVADRHGVDPDAVEDAIQEALMDGRCYEPDDATLKPI